ncbi:MAG: hypothetical protein RL339_1556 [Pseudomonadota bacterium]
MSKRIDLAWMIRTGRAIPGQWICGTLSWSIGDSPAGWISYQADMCDPEASELRLCYTRGSGEAREEVNQTIRLVHSTPHFGGRRWWMVCPFRHNRVAKLYMPNGGDRFASRAAWRLGYQSQRVACRDRPFEKLFRLQKKMGSVQGWEAGLRRPKGMWHSTFERHFERYLELDDQCAIEMAEVMGILEHRF